jgi:cytochrome c-type biogenesis protein CcmH
MFWVTAFVIGVLAAGLMSGPILRQGAAIRNYGLALVLVVPVIALVLYQQVGTPEGISVTGTPQQQQQQAQQGDHTAGGGQVGDMVGQLEQRLQDNPADLQGWILLGRSYKTIQQYAQAETALVRAIQLAPDDPLVLVELAEAKMYASGNPVIGPDAVEMLTRALALDPDQQKGLWLLGIAASQSGDDAKAIGLWERLSTLMDPASGVAASLSEQIAQARSRLGTGSGTIWPGINIEVKLDDPGFETPAGAILFVIARNPQLPGPPVGVRRIENPVFPVRVNLNDSDSMVPQSPVSALQSVQLLARLSMSGGVVAGATDLASPPLAVETGSTEAVKLLLAGPGQ